MKMVIIRQKLKVILIEPRISLPNDLATKTLKVNGIRSYPTIAFFGYSQTKPTILPRKPTWILKIKGMELTINDLK